MNICMVSLLNELPSVFSSPEEKHKFEYTVDNKEVFPRSELVFGPLGWMKKRITLIKKNTYSIKSFDIFCMFLHST
jgi:hypothetical protein